MPALLVPSSTIIDQTFPRDDDQLEIVGIALGEIQDCLEKNEAELVKIAIFDDFIESFDWERTGPYPLLKTIYDILVQWYLQPNKSIIELDLSEVAESAYLPHPVLQGSEQEELVEFWSEEVGKLLVLHDQCCEDNEFFIGIACELAFADEGQCDYADSVVRRCFPLIGPNDLSELADAYKWELPNDIHQKLIRFKDVQKNCNVIGAKSLENPTSGSHYKIRFEGKRPWPLDPNTDPIPARFLRELAEIAGYPVNVVKYALIFGHLPHKTLKISPNL